MSLFHQESSQLSKPIKVVISFIPIHRNVSQKKEFHPSNGMKLHSYASKNSFYRITYLL